MASDSPRKTNKVNRLIVRPQPACDKTVMESVVDFFQDFTQMKLPDDKEKVTWVQFENFPFDELPKKQKQFYGTLKDESSVPILLVLGYSNGVQIWLLMEGGEAQEVMSLRQGPIRHVKFLYNPINATQNDVFSSKRPLIAITDASSAGHAYCSIKFISMATGEDVYSVAYNQPIMDVKCNNRVIAAALLGKISVLDARTFTQKFIIKNCNTSPGINPNPICLGSRWLAYADKMLAAAHQSGGGVMGEGNQTYTATFIHAAKSFKKGITALGETLASSVASQSTTNQQKKVTPTSSLTSQSESKAGIISIIDVMNITEEEVSINEDWTGEGLVAHFPAHANDPVTSLTFDPTGQLLLTADHQGRCFHVFKILGHPFNSTLTTVHHLYVLRRGDTTAKIQSTAFTWDSRWVAVTTVHGTTHVFPITCYGGGPATKRTHMSHRVVSQSSRFHQSAGLDDTTEHLRRGSGGGLGGRDSPVVMVAGAGVVGSSPGASPAHKAQERLKQQQLQLLLNNFNNPRLPPYPQPITINPAVQIRQSYSFIDPGPASKTSSSSKVSSSSSSSLLSVKKTFPDPVCVACCFARSRVLNMGSPTVSRERLNELQLPPVDSLFIATAVGMVTEYLLMVRPRSGLEKVTDDSPIEVEALAKLQWGLSRYQSMSEVHLPLSPSNPLMLSGNAPSTSKPSTPIVQKSKQKLKSDPHQQHHHSKAGGGHGDVGTSAGVGGGGRYAKVEESFDEEWLSQVEIVTHAPPHRRLWMGPQFTFKPVFPTSPPFLMKDDDDDDDEEGGVQSRDVFDAQHLSSLHKKSQPMKITSSSSSSSPPSSLVMTTKNKPHTFSQPPSVGTYIETFESGSYSGQSSLEARWFDSSSFKQLTNDGRAAEERIRASLEEAILDESAASSASVLVSDSPAGLDNDDDDDVDDDDYDSGSDSKHVV